MVEEKRQKRLRFRNYKYAVLSLTLIAILLVTTGCAALLIGDNRKAYDLMVKTSEYFKYPSSVQIASGEIFGDGMYCVIRGKNSYGNYRSDSYYVSESGYPLDKYDSRCYSDKLNVDLINNALAAHFGNSSGNIFSNLIGGSNMSSGGVIAIYIIVLIVVLCLNGFLASNASDIANDKGYEKKKWFHMCFWLGPISYIIIAAMPDQTMRSNQSKTNELLQQLLDKQSVIPASTMTAKKEPKSQQSEDISSFLPDL